MANASDAMLARLMTELDERRLFMDNLVEGAQKDGRDLTKQEMEMFERTRDRMRELDTQIEPLRDGARIAMDSRRKSEELQQAFAFARNPASAQVEYRSAGAYVADLYWKLRGDPEATERIEIFNRVAAHQTTADNAGLLPETIVGPVVNFVDSVRPLVSVIGATDLGAGTWAYAKVTQHTSVAAQSAEKAELTSQKMLITKTAITAPTIGGYVNVSAQDIRRTTPGIMDMIINDLASQYAIFTEDATGDALIAAATAGNTYPATPTAAEIATAIYAAAGDVYAATKGQGAVVVAVSPDMLGVIGPLFPSVNPQSGFGSGFTAAGFSQGNVGNVSGLSVIMSAGLASGTILVFSTAAVRCFEYRYGALQVVEPSVLGVQVGYAGDFKCLVVEAAGVQSVAEGA